jgi:hypothetical protein
VTFPSDENRIMQRGLKIVVAGLIPLLAPVPLSWIVDVSATTARELAPMIFLATGFLFVVGTAIIVTDKGYSALIGLALGIIAPFGTIIALLLEDRRRSYSESPAEAINDIAGTAATGEEAKGSYEALRKIIINIATLAALIYALLHALNYAGYMLKFQGGVPAVKVLFAIVQAVMTGFAMWSAAILFTVTFAPQQWLLNSTTGKKWMARTGLKIESSTIPLRVMTAMIGALAVAWVVLAVTVLMTALMAQE